MLIHDDAYFENVQISWIAWKYASVAVMPRLSSTEAQLNRGTFLAICGNEFVASIGARCLENIFCGRCLKTLRRLLDLEHICSPMLKYAPTLISSAPCRDVCDS